MMAPSLRILAVFFFSFFLGSSITFSESERQILPLEDLRTFADTFHQIRLGYIEEVDDSTLLRYAIQGMLITTNSFTRVDLFIIQNLV